MSVENILTQGVQAQGIACTPEIKRELITFIELLEKWNRVYNLTAIRDREKMATHHILDSLSVLPFLRGMEVLDVGSGAGLPGVPLALMSPEKQFVLIDSNAKKTRFIQQVKAELGLKNLTVTTARIEDFHPEKKFDTILSRAFSSISQMVLATARLCKPEGVIIAMKGEYPQAELQEIPRGFIVKAVLQVQVPLLQAQRHIVQIAPS